MAERRMFSKSVVDSDLFLDMPASTQNLYFHLAMRADDDGFISNLKRIMRMVGSSDDDARLLIAKQFLIPFDTGVVVIRHWKIHNLIRKDRYSETNCIMEKSQIIEGETGEYLLLSDKNIQSWQPDGNQMATTCQPDGNQRLTQVRLGKVRLGKDRPPIAPQGDGNQPTTEKPIEKRFAEFWKAYPKKTGKGQAEKSWAKIKPGQSLFEIIMKSLSEHKASKQWTRDNGQFIPNPATWLNQKRWEDETEVDTSAKYVRDADGTMRDEWGAPVV